MLTRGYRIIQKNWILFVLYYLPSCFICALTFLMDDWMLTGTPKLARCFSISQCCFWLWTDFWWKWILDHGENCQLLSQVSKLSVTDRQENLKPTLNQISRSRIEANGYTYMVYELILKVSPAKPCHTSGRITISVDIQQQIKWMDVDIKIIRLQEKSC